ncbi:hypothetical protein [Aurantibacillus circumpalustris]|uniref:hypothetical protein n=1 Tax=Aurantibacillus circumpalustris TaxID=3036359 RepID=UPI00295BC40A|nr:hypothetical protein [Aurantibacillus circumpalustris]
MLKHINNHTELIEEIRALEKSKREYENQLHAEAKQILELVSDPTPFIKELVHEFSRDKDFRKDLLKIGLSAGANYLGKLMQSPTASDVVFSFLSKKINTINPDGDGIWNRLAKLLTKIKPTKHEQV